MHIHHLKEGSFLVESELGCVLLGSPPEMLKTVRQKNLRMPDTIVLSNVLYANHSSQAAIEFFLYHFMFVQKGLTEGRKLRIIVSEHQIKKLSDMLRVTLLGPTYEEMRASGQSEEWSQQLIKETKHLALKNKQGDIYQVEDLIDWQILEIGEEMNLWLPATPIESTTVDDSITLRRTDGSTFELETHFETTNIDLTVKGVQKASYPIEHRPIDLEQKHVSLTILGASDGFDPLYASNGYLFNFNGKIGIWDSPPYLNQHLKAFGVELNQIEAMIISHVHDDHLDVVESLCSDKPLNIYCTAEVYFSLLVKLSAIVNCDLTEAAKYYHWHKVSVGVPFFALGAEFTLFYSVHSIPSVGCRISVPDENSSEKNISGCKKILISGDHLPFTGIENMFKQNILSASRYEESIHLVKGDEDIILIDAGGGILHGNYWDYMSIQNRIYFYHTSRIDQNELNHSKQLLKPGQILT